MFANKPGNKTSGWSQDLGEHGQQDLTWLL